MLKNPLRYTTVKIGVLLPQRISPCCTRSVFNGGKSDWHGRILREHGWTGATGKERKFRAVICNLLWKAGASPRQAGRVALLCFLFQPTLKCA